MKGECVMKWLTLPNLLSLSRLVFLPLLFLLLYVNRPDIFLICYVLLASTDLFDGIVARKLGLVSRLGKDLDSLADLFFYIASAYFLCYLFPEVILANRIYLIVFFSILGFSFLLSGILFHRPVMMHTRILRLCAVLVTFLVITSFWFNTVFYARLILLIYCVGFIEEILIFIFFGNVNPDTQSIFNLINEQKQTPAA
jgi:phosphatidylglycerophosphate synthase